MNPSPIATLTFDLKNRVRYEFNSQGLTPFTTYSLTNGSVPLFPDTDTDHYFIISKQENGLKHWDSAFLVFWTASCLLLSINKFFPNLDSNENFNL